MGKRQSQMKKRERIRSDIATAFSQRTSIGKEEFIRTFYDSDPPPPIGHFDREYVSARRVYDAIFSDLSAATGLDVESIKAKFSLEKSFMQFGEHLLEEGAYSGEEK